MSDFPPLFSFSISIFYFSVCVVLNRAVMSNSLQSHGLLPARLLCPWGFSRQEYWSGRHALLQGIYPTQGLNPSLPHCRQTLYCLSYQGSSFHRPSHYQSCLQSHCSCVKCLTKKNHLGNPLVVQRLGPLTSIGKGTDHWLGKLACHRRSQRSLYQCHFSSSIYQFIKSPS